MAEQTGKTVAAKRAVPKRRLGLRFHWDSTLDYSLLIMIGILSAFGLLMIYSTTSYADSISHAGNSYYTVTKQAVYLVIALLVMAAVSRIDYHVWLKYARVLYVAAVILGIAVLFLGKEVNGQKRWFSLGPISFQPAEFAKLALIISMAALADFYYGMLRYYRVLFVFFMAALPIALPVLSANLSSGLILMGIAFVMAFIASRRKIIFGIVIGVGVILVVVLYRTGILEVVLDEYQMNRINAWFDPLAYSSTNGFQTVQGLYAIGAGGWFGRGLGQSLQSLGYLPEAQNDMIFSIICEELGLIGAILVICMFLLLVYRLMQISSQAKDFKGTMIAAGIMAHIAIQVLMNVAVVTNTMPNTGVSLPFISYGGSSVTFLMVEMGIVLNIAGKVNSSSAT
ncbi:MAG: cell division protein FtsW [Lachnospiraceae bacterium]|nr:cell division protein FtsW [Lachnospiraceae bacterium]